VASFFLFWELVWGRSCPNIGRQRRFPHKRDKKTGLPSPCKRDQTRSCIGFFPGESKICIPSPRDKLLPGLVNVFSAALQIHWLPLLRAEERAADDLEPLLRLIRRTMDSSLPSRLFAKTQSVHSPHVSARLHGFILIPFSIQEETVRPFFSELYYGAAD